MEKGRIAESTVVYMLSVVFEIIWILFCFYVDSTSLRK